MTHLVFGTGLIGGFIAGGLLHAGIDTRLIGREKQRKAMHNGLTLSDLDHNRADIDPPTFLSTGAQDDESPDIRVLWLTVKCTAVQSSIAQISTIISPETVIICCQNGFGSDAPIRQAFNDNPILQAVIGFNVSEQGEAHLHRSTDGSLVIESFSELNSTFERLHCGLLPVHLTNNITAERWAKLQLNLANSVNALSDIPTKAMTEDPYFRRVIAALMSELLDVTNAMKLPLPKLTPLPAAWLPKIMRLPNWLYLKLAQKTLAIDPTARVSMWWDLSQGKQSEIEYLNQAVVDHGSALGIECPLNAKISELIRKVEQGDESIGISGPELARRLGIL